MGSYLPARLGQSAVLPRAADHTGARSAPRHAPCGRARRPHGGRIHADPAGRRADLSVGELPPASGRRSARAPSRDRPGTDRLWRTRFNSPLPIVAGGYEFAAYVVFYSLDHPKMYADFDPALSSWIDYPGELKRKGFIGACLPYAPDCIAKFNALDPAAETLSGQVTREIGGMKGDTMIYDVRISKPAR